MDVRQNVAVIAAYDPCGQLRPLRFRFEGADRGLHRVDVEQVVQVREVSYVGIEALIFLCRARVEEWERMLELKYTICSHSWELLRWIY